jgi:L,D-transpeptidase YcbB
MADILKFILFFIISIFDPSGEAGYQLHDKKISFHDIMEEYRSVSINENLVNRYYVLNGQHLSWFTLDSASVFRRRNFKKSLDSCQYAGLDKMKYHYQEIAQHYNDLFLPEDSIRAMQIDRIFTDAAILYGLDIYHGAGIAGMVAEDELSPEFQRNDESVVIKELIKWQEGMGASNFGVALEPTCEDYRIIKAALRTYTDSPDRMKLNQLITSINLFRWIHHFSLGKYIVVNIPSASLYYYENDSVFLEMKVVVGKPSTRTPRFAAYCDKIIYFPYWNVPNSIAVKEYLPVFKQNPAMVSVFNMQVIDKNGNIVPDEKIKWSLYSKTYFPYRIRQSTGCDNALGVIKFNLTSPFDVYLHDTNMKSAFNATSRFFSHGCIRLEKPFQLAERLLEAPVDSIALVTPSQPQPSKTVNLPRPVPVFVVYMTAEVKAGQILYYRDVYNLLK